jgi:plasmid stabilization system protein ParE
MRVVWTSIAEKHYYTIIDYIFETWGLKTMNEFIDEVEKCMDIIETNPYCFEEYELNKDYRKGIIHENVSFFYRIYNNEIVVHLFWNNSQNPKKLKKILK